MQFSIRSYLSTGSCPLPHPGLVVPSIAQNGWFLVPRFGDVVVEASECFECGNWRVGFNCTEQRSELLPHANAFNCES